ncbi:phenylacetate--CoA ligase family protein [Parashewanella spongiae]|uniref:Phenylacetate--CoA ligase family protein n=1 Tax=Parashewanella spongiae TaxID=342950 RepID=A0A3A6TD05_9GAMM|nr:AMP-binding protein [Parashewanella spongiae]MCL1079179.1 AMP-binding protein [Parashewanella spongiae]RJY10569.1 phenylacetate--CoA ligase family protein [Parashewanella spongiae]
MSETNSKTHEWESACPFINTIASTSAKESLPQAAREIELFHKLKLLVTRLAKESEYYSKAFSDIQLLETSHITRENLAKLPLIRKSDLAELQAKNSPFGGITSGRTQLQRLFQSPGNIYEGAMDSVDWWRMSQAFHSAGFTHGDVVLNTLSYHLTPGGFIMDSGARACGCTVIPAGPGQTEQQLDAIAHFKPNGYCGTPSFLNILIDKAKLRGHQVSFTKALVTGEALTSDLRQKFIEHGINVKQAYATADVGLIAFEGNASEGWVLAEDIIVEIVKPGSGELVRDGEVGELVVTTLDERYPLVRFATGDLTAYYKEESSCGRTNHRIKGWLGRADQMVKVKGMFVHLSQLEKIVSLYPEISNARFVVTRENHNDVFTFEYSSNADLDSYLANTIKNVTKLSASISKIDELPQTNKIIDLR